MKSERLSFWKLLESNYITMPLYQRDYVQGRKDTAAELIREEFVSDLIKAMLEQQEKELHFIFGGKDNVDQDVKHSFVPVDGQQRLTTLFLLHWYVLSQSGATDTEKKQLSKFSYASRDTSKRFCEMLVTLLGEEPLFLEETVGKFVENQYWFTGNIKCDPTVASMLVVLDEIQRQFRKIENPDWTGLKNLLRDENCPLVFLCLDMENELGSGNEIRDLYIKMNDRGKQLTDFENFKAYLHKKIRQGDQFDLLGAYLENIQKEPDSEANRVELLGKINNAHTDFFFRIIDEGKIKDSSCSEDRKEPSNQFDTAMMNFFNEMIRMEFFRFVHESKVNDKTYRDHGEEIAKMSGKALYHFVISRGEKYLKEYKLLEKTKDSENEILKGFSRAVRILDVLVGENPAENQDILRLDTEEGACSLLRIIRQSVGEKSNKELAISRAMFAFVEKFGLRRPDDPLLRAWSRLVWRCGEFTDFYHFNDACAVGTVLEKIIGKMPENSQLPELWKSIRDAESSCEPLEHHFKEERIKAQLLLEDSALWENLFMEAENWNGQGQIYYLLELARQHDGTYCAAAFRKNLDFFRNNFHWEIKNSKEKLVLKGDAAARRAFENALLVFSEPEEDVAKQYYHLLKKDKGGSQMRFSYDDYSAILSTKMAEKPPHKTILNVICAVQKQAEDTLLEKLEALIVARRSTVEDWRVCFLDPASDLYALQFPGNPKNETAVYITDDSYCLLFKDGKQKHKESTEIHIAVLFDRLTQAGKSAILKMGTHDMHWRAGESYPARHLICQEETVYYFKNAYRIYGQDKEYTLSEILEKFSA